MTTIFIYFLTFISFYYLAYEKFKLADKLMNTKYKVLYKIGKCEFCFSFWISVFTVIFIKVVANKCNFSTVDIVMPFVISGLWIIVKNFGNE